MTGWTSIPERAKVFSRYVVGWMVAHRESATLAEQFIHETCARQAIGRDHLTIHADRGAAMTSKPVAFLLADLGVTKTHARPHVSNDNPVSEAQFKTLKYRPDFPERFGAIQNVRAHCRWLDPPSGAKLSELTCSHEFHARLPACPYLVDPPKIPKVYPYGDIYVRSRE